MAIRMDPQGGGEAGGLIEQINRLFAEPGNHDAVLRVAACCTIPEFADLTVLVLLRDGRVDRLEVGAPEAASESEAAELITPALPAITRIALNDWASGRHFRWFSHIGVTTTRFLAGEPEVPRLLAALHITSLMVVPLRAVGQLLGAIAFARTRDSKLRYHAKDLALAQVIARRIAIAIDYAELQKRSAEDERRRARLEQAVQKWIKVFDVAAWGAAIVDANDLRIDAANPALARMHGYSESDSLLGQPYTALLPSDRAGETAGWAREGERSNGYESVHLHLTGRTFPVFTSITRLETRTGEESYVVTVQDMTELKRAEERLRRAQRMEAVGRLAGGVAHEVNNMMTIILGFSDLLTRAPDLPPDRQADVEQVRKAAMRTALVTQQLLAFSRQQILQPTDLQLNEIVLEMNSVLEHLLPANIKVEKVLSPFPASVRVDRAQVDQVLINLAFNARDAMPLGGTLRLATESRHFEPDDVRHLIGIPMPEGQYATLSVSDTGHGMTPETLSQVFEPFFTTKPVGTGTGLGLATVYGIVKQSGGFVWVESELGVGTTFTVCFPQIQSRLTAPTGTLRDEPEEVHPNATILLVEDEEGVRELARRVLEQEGFRVLEVRSGADAIAALEARPAEIDLVLSDVVTPDLAAVELEKVLRARRSELPLLYMSGYSWEEVVSRGLVSGERRFIQKPFTPAELVHAVTDELRKAAPVVGR